jgi:putative transposase
MAGRAHRSSAGQSARRRAPTIATQPSSTSITPSWDALRRDIKPVYAAVTAAAARAALDELAELWGQRYGAIIRLWANAWEQFIPFLDYDTEIRKVICSTDAIVIWSPRRAVLHVDHKGLTGRVLPGGGGYLPLSITRISRRSNACSAGAHARLVA